jgi:hypothetical protein
VRYDVFCHIFAPVSVQDVRTYFIYQGRNMPNSDYRIESSSPLLGRLLPPASCQRLYTDRSLAVAVAVKSVFDPSRQPVRVVYVPTGEIVFETCLAPLDRSSAMPGSPTG